MASSKKKKVAPKKAAKKASKKPVKKAPKKTAKKAAAKPALKAKSAKKVVPKKASKKTKAVAKKPVVKTAAKPTATKPTGKIQFTPVHDHILVMQDGESDRTPGGLYIPATVQDKPQRGRVLAIGTGTTSKKGRVRPLDVKIGETVIFSAHSGSKVTLSGTDYLVLKEEDVLGVLPK